MKQFEIGKTYTTRSLCNHDCIITIKVTARTAQTITVINDSNEVQKLRIIKKMTEWNNAETVLPWGKYSMAPIITAEKIAE